MDLRSFLVPSARPYSRVALEKETDSTTKPWSSGSSADESNVPTRAERRSRHDRRLRRTVEARSLWE